MLNRIPKCCSYFFFCLSLLLAHPFLANAQTVNYETLYDNSNFSKSIDLSKPVGILEGQHAVTPSGAATYNIPIKLAPGTNGMAPSVSISYSSQTGNGLVGYGWNLAGISMITAAPHTLYYDSVNAPSSVDDNYLLDGNRLLKNPGDGAEYLTEVTDYTLVRQIGGTSQTFTYFTALSKDGKVAEYGSDPNARMPRAGTSRWYAWFLNKVTDESGNYMLYDYADINGEKLLSEIRYTGNDAAGLQPYNSVKFIYAARRDANTLRSAEGTVYKRNLLQRIEVYAEGTLFRTYEFTYGLSDHYSFLKEVEETDGAGISLNATSFKYGDLTDGTFVTSTASVGTDYFTADVDGDGITDIIVPQQYTLSTTAERNLGYKIYKGNATGSNFQTYATVSLPGADYFAGNSWRIGGFYKQINTTYQKIVATDFDGNGRDDILRLQTYITNTVSAEQRTAAINLLMSDGNGHFTRVDYDLPANNGEGYEIKAKSNLLLGDFDGDKLPEALLIVRNPNDNYHTRLFCFKQGTGIIDVRATQLIAEAFDGADEIFTGDFDGDGDVAFYLKKDDHIDVYALDLNGANGTIRAVKNLSFAVSYYKEKFEWTVWPGDFNGDGITDLFIIDKNSEAAGPLTGKPTLEPSPAVAYGTGDSFEISGFIPGNSRLPTLHYSETRDQGNGYATHDWIIIGDYNGDGKSDILHEYKSTFGGLSHLETYYSNGYNTWAYQAYEPGIAFPDRQCPCVQVSDLNGDNRSDIFTGTNLLTIRPNSNDKLLEKIRTGLGNETSFEYSSLSRSANFSNDFTNYGTDLVTRTLPFTNVMRVTTNGGLTGITPTITSYYYSNPVLHLMGKGFIGFMSFKAVDSTANKTIETQTKLQTIATSNPRIRVLPVGSKTTTTLIHPAQTLSVSEQTTTLKRIGSSDLFSTDQTTATATDFLSGVTTTSVSTYDDYGNATSATENIANGLEQKNTTVSYVTTSNGYPYPSKPEVQTITSTRQGNASVSSSNKYTYGAKGLLTTSVSNYGTPNAVTSSFIYSPCGNITKTTKTVSGVVAMSAIKVYDTKYRFAIQTGNTLLQYSYFTYDPRFGSLLTARGIDGLTTTNVYNSFGDLVQTTSATGVVTDLSKTWEVQNGTYWYALTTAAGAPDVKKWYDGLGREVRADVASMNNQWTTQRTTYDARGNVSTKTNAYLPSETPLTTTNTYDAYNRLTSSGNSVFGTVQTAISYSSGNTVQTITDAAGRISTKTTDAAGRLIKVKDNGGELNYRYDSRGNITNVAQGANTFIANEYNAYGQKTKSTDFSSGITTYEYDAYGRLTAETDARNNRHTITYNTLGDISRKAGPEGSTSYSYYGAGGGLANQLKKVTAFSGITEEYTYDSYGRVANQKKTIDGLTFQHNYTYNAQNQVVTKMFPSGYQVRNSYDGAGYLTNVRNDYYANPYSIYTAQAINGYGQPTKYTLADGVQTAIGYYYGLPVSYATVGASIQSYSLSYDYTTGNITKRSDNLRNFSEAFTYDNLDRLTNATVTGYTSTIGISSLSGGMRGPILGGGGAGITPVTYPASTISYDQNTSTSWGNIKSKSDVGDYDYKKHAVMYVSNTAGNISSLQQDVRYTPFNRPDTISENGYQQTFRYDDTYNRAQSVLKQNGVVKETRYYLGDCDITLDAATGQLRYIQYVSGGDGLAAIVVVENGQDKAYSVYKDHLGSILKLTDNTGAVVAEQNFDAWGRKRNPTDWSYNNVPAAPAWLIRGYTGHEDMPQFGLINMNARLYDPLLGRMLSPDDYVKEPTATQDFNRYTYARNNPLKYNDPDGNFWNIVIGAAIGGVMNTVTHWDDIVAGGGINWTRAATAFGIGAVAGGVAGATFGMSTVASGGFVAAANAAAFGTAVSQPILYGGNAAAFGDAMPGGKEILASLGMSYVTGGLLGGIGAYIHGRDFWTGNGHLMRIYTAPVADPTKAAELNPIELKEAVVKAEGSTGEIHAGEYTITKTVAKNVMTRPYINSPSTITNIMESGVGIPDLTFPGGMNWKVPGAFNDSNGIFELGINPKTNVIYHFLFRGVK